MPQQTTAPWNESAARLLRSTFYIAVATVGLALFLWPVWPPGGPHTKQAHSIAMLLSSILGILGICAVVIYLTDPQFQ